MICSRCKAEHAVGQNVAVLGTEGLTEYFCLACWPKPPHAAQQPLTTAQAANAEEDRLDVLEDLEAADQRIAGFRAENQRLRRELLAVVAVGEKLRADLEQAQGSSLDYSRDLGRVHHALDEAGVPKSNPDAGRPWRVDDRVKWLVSDRELVGGCVDRLEVELHERGCEVAELQHRLDLLMDSACRLALVRGVGA